MTRHIPSPQRIAALKLEAKHTGRANGVGHSQALDEIAVREGYASWSLLAKASDEVFGSSNPEQPPPFRYTRTLEEQRRAFFLVSNEESMVEGSHVNRIRVEDLTAKFDSGLTALRFARDYMRNVVRLPRFQIRGRTAGYWEMRQWLPYGLQALEGSDQRIAINRYYKPVGSTDLDRYFDYSELPHVAVRIDAGLLERVSGGSVGFFYNDGCPPWRSRAMAEQYLGGLEEVVAHLKG
jgi:hypothetical protein